MAKKNKARANKQKRKAASSPPPRVASVAPEAATATEPTREEPEVTLLQPPAPLERVDAEEHGEHEDHEEHRESPRASLIVELHLASDSHFFTGLSGDISEGGIFVSTYRDLSAGSAVDLEFSLPGTEEPLHLRGTVRWHRDASPDVPPGVGIAFDDLKADDRQRIHRFCRVRPPLFYDVA